MTAGTGLSRALICALPLVFLNSVMIAGDPRIAYAGKRLRKLGPNGLPQFIKVFCGDIAAVTRNILVVKPQVNSLRAFEESVNSFCQNVHTVFYSGFSVEKAVA